MLDLSIIPNFIFLAITFNDDINLWHFVASPDRCKVRNFALKSRFWIAQQAHAKDAFNFEDLVSK